MNDKLRSLKNLLADFESVLVAYSGGVDSTLLLKTAQEVLGERAAGLIVISPILPERELEQARQIAREQGFRLIEMASAEMELPEFRDNSERRCYFCKDYRYRMLNTYAAENGFQTLLDGGNADDLGDYRPGLQAAREQSVRSPLQELGFRKQEIRELARELGLSNWNKPSSACLASRIPYGTEISLERIQQIDRAENLLFELGYREFRVRHHGSIARIEIPAGEFPALIEHRQELIQAFKDLGFLYITLDLGGFRSGSMNEGIDNG